MMANWQIKINWGKTKEMVVKRGGGSCNVSGKGGRIEEVKVMNFYNHNIYIYIYIYMSSSHKDASLCSLQLFSRRNPSWPKRSEQKLQLPYLKAGARTHWYYIACNIYIYTQCTHTHYVNDYTAQVVYSTLACRSSHWK